MTGDIVDKQSMVMSNLSDLEVALRVRMLMRSDLDHEAVCVGARDRIMFLSQEVDRWKDIAACAAAADTKAEACKIVDNALGKGI